MRNWEFFSSLRSYYFLLGLLLEKWNKNKYLSGRLQPEQWKATGVELAARRLGMGGEDQDGRGLAGLWLPGGGEGAAVLSPRVRC